jgi:hypothetical protein
VEFGHGPVDVGLGGQRADDQAVGDLVDGQALCGQGDRLAFAAGQLLQPAAGSGEGRLGDVPVDELSGDRGREQGVTAGGDAYGVQEVLRDDVLDEGVLARGVPGVDGCSGATATSTPKTGRIPAATAAFANPTVPATVSRSVNASVVFPRSATRWTRAPGSAAP